MPVALENLKAPNAGLERYQQFSLILQGFSRHGVESHSLRQFFDGSFDYAQDFGSRLPLRSRRENASSSNPTLSAIIQFRSDRRCAASPRRRAQDFQLIFEREHSLRDGRVSVSGLEGTFLARYFDCCEINTSFYGPLKPASAKSWCDHVAGVNSAFAFTAKLTQVFTHAPAAKTTSSSAATIKYSQKDVDEAKAGFEPLLHAGRLGAVIAQFPISFKFKEKKRSGEPETLHGNWDHVLDVLNLFREYPLAIEFRDASWNDDWVLKELRERSVAFCNVDQPRLGNSLDGTAYVTAPFAYLRMHGRNYDKWFKGTGRDERYDFLYEGERLERVKKRVAEMATNAQKTFVIANNHPRGQAAVNVLELKSMLGGKKVAAPPELIEAYPDQLQKIATPELSPGPGQLKISSG